MKTTSFANGIHSWLHSCANLNDHVMESIAEYVPHIQSLWFCASKNPNLTFNLNKTKCYGKFIKIKSLDLGLRSYAAHTNSAFHKIVVSDIPLERLASNRTQFTYYRLFEDISKLKSLQTLVLINASSWQLSHILPIKHLKSLSELHFGLARVDENSCEGLLVLIQSLEQLQVLGIRWNVLCSLNFQRPRI